MRQCERDRTIGINVEETEGERQRGKQRARRLEIQGRDAERDTNRQTWAFC